MIKLSECAPWSRVRAERHDFPHRGRRARVTVMHRAYNRKRRGWK